MPFAAHNGVNLHWREQGQGSAVLLIMGHRYSSAMWYPVRDALAERHRVISFDNRGTGDSDTTSKVTVEALAGDALAVMDDAGVESAHVYGVSMGGVIALELALQRPDRVKSLILGCTGILSPEKPRMPAILRLLYYVPPKLLNALLNRGGDHGYGAAAPAEKVAHDQTMLAKDRFSTRGVIAQAAAIAGYSVDPGAVRKLTMPALVLHGDEDKTVPFAYAVELSQTLPNSQLVKLDGAGHNYFIAQGEKANEAVSRFLQACDG